MHIFSFSRVFCRIVLTFFCMKSALFAQNYGGNYDWRMLTGGPLQLISFHVGTNTSITHNHTGYNIGGSFGWNYLSSFYDALNGIDHIFDIGLRAKYMFYDSVVKSHLVGAELYLHFPCSTTDTFRNVPQPISLVLGSGAIFANTMQHAPHITGHYIEAGIGLFKYFFVNANLLYRVSFFPQNAIGLERVEQSFVVEFAIF